MKVITRIVVEVDVPQEQITPEILAKHKQEIAELIESETDDSAIFNVTVEY